MRVISGSARGQVLKAPEGLNTRPTTDRVKESIFNIIQRKISGSIVIDFFSGSGNLGIECLSRNANKAYFIDNNKKSTMIIKENLSKTKLEDFGVVIQTDVLSSMEMLKLRGVKADIICLDPPYSKGLVEPTLKGIEEFDLLDEGGIVIVEHKRTDEVPDVVYKLNKYRTNNYGDVAVSFYELRKE